MAFSVTNDFTAGTNAVASEVNQNFTDVETELNAFPTNGTLSDGAVSTTAKLANSIITSAKFAAAALVTEAEGLDSSDNDTSFPTTAAVKDYTDTAKTGTADLTISTTAYTSNPVSTVTSWTDIDLSAIVGSAKTLIYLRVVQDGGGTIDIAFRTNGQTGNVGLDSNSNYGAGASAMTLGNDFIGYAVVVTDTNGKIEHKAGQSAAGETFNLFVDAWLAVN